MTVVKTFYKLKWPDLVEIRTNNEGQENLTFVFLRSNSRPFDYQQTEFAHTLQQFGHDVVVRISNLAEISLEDFEKHGVYSVRNSQTVQNPQGLRNKMNELRQLEAELSTLDPEDPVYYNKAQRVQHLRTMLSTAETQPTLKQLRESDKRLRELERLQQEQAPLTQQELSDEQLARLPISVAVRWHNKQDELYNERLWNKWSLVQAQAHLNVYRAELTLQPGSLELRSQILKQEQKVQELAKLTEDHNEQN